MCTALECAQHWKEDTTKNANEIKKPLGLLLPVVITSHMWLITFKLILCNFNFNVFNFIQST